MFRHARLALAALAVMLTTIGCAGYCPSFGRVEVLVPLRGSLDSASSCLVAAYASSDQSQANYHYQWRNYCRSLKKLVDDEGIFSDVTLEAGSQRYRIITVVDSVVKRAFSRTRMQKSTTPGPYRGKYPEQKGPRTSVPKSYTTYSSSVLRWVAVRISLEDESTGEVLFCVRVWDRKFPETFARELGAEVRRTTLVK